MVLCFGQKLFFSLQTFMLHEICFNPTNNDDFVYVQKIWNIEQQFHDTFDSSQRKIADIIVLLFGIPNSKHCLLVFGLKI